MLPHRSSSQNRVRRRLVVCGILAVIVGGWVLWRIMTAGSQPQPLVDEATLAKIPIKDASHIDTSHVAAGLLPPTNKWFSGLALQKIPKTVFPTPLAVTLTDTSFAVSLPAITTTPNTIFASRAHSLNLAIKSATVYKVTRYDELSADLTYYDHNRPLGVLTIVAGSPYIWFRSQTDLMLSVSPMIPDIKLAAFDEAKVTPGGISLPANGLVALYAAPAGTSNDQLAQVANNPIKSVAVSYQKIGNSYQTSLKFTTAKNQPTYIGLLPHQRSDAKSSFTIDTLYGQQRFVKTVEARFDVPYIPVESELAVNQLSNTDRIMLNAALQQDIQKTDFQANDTYADGKALYRAAELLRLANQLGNKEQASIIELKLKSELTKWLSVTPVRTDKRFYYDPTIHGLVGEAPSFGSEQFNDHHFHYGYFIYAAAILGSYDKGFVREYAPYVNLLVADIAGWEQGQSFPVRRMFDPYFGHSWASGSAPFDDGNNQESSSEAINAWTGLSLWADVSKNHILGDEAGWMLSNEAASAGSYWLDIDQTQSPFRGSIYSHSLVALNWGGKRDFATFFSTKPSAALGIQLIPMNPSQSYQTRYGKRISQQIAETISDDNYNVSLGDYILMYKSLADKSKADQLDRAKKINDEFIDSANSRTYLYAWIMTH